MNDRRDATGRRGRVMKWLLVLVAGLAAAGGAAAATWFYAPPAVTEVYSDRYATADEMVVPVTEFTTFEYPEDPSSRSDRYGQYGGRRLRLIKRDATHFDFVFEPKAGDDVATVTFANIDVSRMTPGQPEWCKGDAGLTRIALTDREWNRQQVRFPVPGSNVTVEGGDGWEAENLTVAALAKNCLNAGLWEVLLSHQTAGGKRMYYQGWFTFPLGHYRDLVEANAGIDYADYWFGLEHWDDPAGTAIAMERLRTVDAERAVAAAFDPDEPLAVAGEQVRKKRTLKAPGVRTWGQFPKRPDVRFATFIPPGTYSVDHPWGNEYTRLAKFEGATLRDVMTADGQRLNELELAFTGLDGRDNRFVVGGVDLASLPQLPVGDYPEGLYMPMGIGVPPFYADYADLLASDPMRSPYYSFLLDGRDRWIDHHAAAIDGPVMHRDADDPTKVHLYLLSYERHTLVAHFVIDLSPANAESDAEKDASPA